MVSLYVLARKAEPGEYIRWRAEDGDYEKPEPRKIERIIHEEGRITVEAEGPKGASAQFRVEENGESVAHYRGKDMGSVEKAELVDRDVFTEPWCE